jgi:hypothetical protein
MQRTARTCSTKRSYAEIVSNNSDSEASDDSDSEASDNSDGKVSAGYDSQASDGYDSDANDKDSGSDYEEDLSEGEDELSDDSLSDVGDSDADLDDSSDEVNRQMAARENESTFTTYSAIDKEDVRVVHRYMRAWKTKGLLIWEKVTWNALLSRFVWSAEEVSSERMALTTKVVRFVSCLLAEHYDTQFENLVKTGGIPLVYRNTTMVCDICASLLVRRTRHSQQFTDLLVKDSNSAIFDPVRELLAKEEVQSYEQIGQSIFDAVAAELLELSPLGCVRRIAAGATAVIKMAIDDGIGDVPRFAKFWAKPDRVASGTSTHGNNRTPTFGVMRTAPHTAVEHRIKVMFNEPGFVAVAYAHVPFTFCMEDLLAHIAATCPSFSAALAKSGFDSGSFRLYWKEQPMVTRAKNCARWPARGELNSKQSRNIVIDACLVGSVTDITGIDEVFSAQSLVDQLADTPCKADDTIIVVRIPKMRGEFDVTKYRIVPTKSTKYRERAFKKKLTTVLARIKTFVESRVAKRMASSVWARSAYPTANEIAFYRNLSKISITTHQ